MAARSRATRRERLAQTQGNFDRIVWITDGLDDDGARALAAELQRRGRVTARLPAQTARAIVSGAVTPQGVVAEVRRAPDGGGVAAIAAETAEGRSLGAAEVRFAGGALNGVGAHRTAAGDRRARRARAHRRRTERRRACACCPRARGGRSSG